MNREKSRILKNGITLYSYTNPSLHGFFISLFLRSGSMYENERESGITHFFEHVAIRNVNARMNGALYPMLDRYGIEFNAATYSEMVQFYVSGATENVGRAIPILAELFSPIVLSAAEISAERERIKAEIRESDERGSLASFTAAAVYSGTSLARAITGTPKSLGGITRRRLEEYRKRVFSPENLFIYVTGNVPDSELDGLAELIGSIPLSGCEIHGNVAPVCDNFGKRGGNALVKSGDFTMARFNFDLDMSRVSSAECDLLYDVLLGGYDSRLFMELSERRGLFYDVSGAIERYRNIGCLYFYYELSPSKLYEAVELTLAELSALCDELLSDERMMKVGYVENGRLLYDSPRDLNFTLAYDNHIMSSGYDSIDARSALYSAITPERLREVANIIFRPENLTLTVKGNKKKIDTDELRRLCNNFREKRK